jgi:hypothetical protein
MKVGMTKQNVHLFHVFTELERLEELLPKTGKDSRKRRECLQKIRRELSHAIGDDLMWWLSFRKKELECLSETDEVLTNLARNSSDERDRMGYLETREESYKKAQEKLLYGD